MRGAVRLKDIALRLGVSVNTVSHALRDLPDIGADTKERVKKRHLKWGMSRIKPPVLFERGNRMSSQCPFLR